MAAIAQNPMERRHKILVVDDEVVIRELLVDILSDEGFEVQSAPNGRVALEKLRADGDLVAIFTDIMMPEMDGMDTMQEIRKLPQGRDLPMIAVTAKAMKGDRQKCIEAGAWDYLSKPVNTMDLLTVLRAWLR